MNTVNWRISACVFLLGVFAWAFLRIVAGCTLWIAFFYSSLRLFLLSMRIVIFTTPLTIIAVPLHRKRGNPHRQ